VYFKESILLSITHCLVDTVCNAIVYVRISYAFHTFHLTNQATTSTPTHYTYTHSLPDICSCQSKSGTQITIRLNIPCGSLF